MNQIIISGNLGADPEVKQVGDYQITSFPMAHTPWSKSKGEGEPIWFRVRLFGDKGDVIAQNFTKGDTVQVIGAFTISSYKDKEGNAKNSYDITATEVTAVVKAVKRGARSASQDEPGW